MKALLIMVLMAVCLSMAGCEDDDDTTVNEAQDIIVGSNSQVIVVSDNSGTIVVDQTTSPDNEDPSIFVTGNTGKVYVTTQPYIPPVPEPEPEPAI